MYSSSELGRAPVGWTLPAIRRLAAASGVTRLALTQAGSRLPSCAIHAPAIAYVGPAAARAQAPATPNPGTTRAAGSPAARAAATTHGAVFEGFQVY
jgi:hypothetical protein